MLDDPHQTFRPATQPTIKVNRSQNHFQNIYCMHSINTKDTSMKQAMKQECHKYQRHANAWLSVKPL